jgi:hypothetical protein
MNPNLPTAANEGEFWTKILSAYLYREGIGEIVIGPADVQRVKADAARPVLVVQELIDGIHVKQIPFADAMELAKQTKGGFGKS